MKIGADEGLDGDLTTFNSDSKYGIMFGPDICGGTKKVHLIFSYNGKNLDWKKTLAAPTDKLTHVYTAIVHPDNTYEVQIDGVKKESGNLEEDWDFLPPKKIVDHIPTMPIGHAPNSPLENLTNQRLHLPVSNFV